MVWTEHLAQTRSLVTYHTHQLSSWLLHHHCPTPHPPSWSQGFWEGDSASLLAQPAWPLTFRAPRLSRPPDCLSGG